MKILKVVDGEYPWDVRVEKVALALTGLGHDVHMVARNRDRRVLQEELPEAHMHRMEPWPWLGRLGDAAVQFPAFLNPRWYSLINRTGREQGVHAIVVRDLPLAPTAIWAGRSLRVPVILDMAENYPAMIRDLWTTGATKFGDVLVRNPSAVEAVERYVMARIDPPLAVVDESRDRLIADFNVSPDAVTVVSNTPTVERIEKFAGIAAAAGARDDVAMRITYLGLMEEARGVGLLIDAVAAVVKNGVSVTLDLIGDGRARADFEASVARHGLSGEQVRFHGFLPYEEALAKVAEADVGIIPHYANESWETTIPNKLFDYMSLGLPVVSSDVSPVVRVLDSTGAGMTFKDRDSGDLARVLSKLAADPDRAALGKAGIRAIREEFNWESDVERLRQALATVVPDHAHTKNDTSSAPTAP